MRILSDEEENELKTILWSLNGFECKIAANILLGVNLKWSKNDFKRNSSVHATKCMKEEKNKQFQVVKYLQASNF